MIESILKLFKGSNRQANIELAQAYKEVFASEAGQKVLTDLMKFGKIVEPTYQPNDPYTSAYYEGMRRVGLRILSFINTDIRKVEEFKINEENLND